MDRSILWRAALVQTLCVALLFAVLALALPRSFFEDWGAATGPAAWIAASLVTWRVLRLALAAVALAAAISGGIAAVIGIGVAHAVALPVAIGLFALLCATLSESRLGEVATNRG